MFEKIVYGNHQSFKQFWVQAVCKSYQQKTLAYCHYLYHASFYLQIWSNVSGLSITKNDSNSSRIKIEFVMGDQKGRPFDGPGGELARSLYPEEGNIYFDGEENWTLGTPSGKYIH